MASRNPNLFQEGSEDVLVAPAKTIEQRREPDKAQFESEVVQMEAMRINSHCVSPGAHENVREGRPFRITHSIVQPPAMQPKNALEGQIAQKGRP